MKIIFQALFFAILLLSLYLSLIPASTHVSLLVNDKLVHMAGYFVLMLSFDFSMKSGNALLLKAVLVLLYSFAIEYAQGFVPGREVSLLDMGANLAGVVAFLACVPFFKKLNVYERLRIA